MTPKEILENIQYLGGYHSVIVPEFTYEGCRIDAILIDFVHRLIRGFEIKVDRNDFLKDDKWTLYSQFCSSLSIVCPKGLIKKEEVEKPFGLLWVSDTENRFNWVQRPKNFQKRNSLSWLWTYVKVLEIEFPRIHGELQRLKVDKKYLERDYTNLQGKYTNLIKEKI